MSDIKDPVKAFQELLAQSRGNRPATEQIDQSRRRFSRAGLATPVIMSLASRSVWGAECSLSGDIMSGNASQHNHDCSLGVGCTPGFWQTKLTPWDLTGYTPGDCANNASGTCKVYNVSNGTLFQTVFGFGLEGDALDQFLVAYPIDMSLMQVLWVNGNAGSSQLDRHAVAAVLNCRAYVGYGASEAQIVQAWIDARINGTVDEETLKNVLAAMNERGCPIDAHGVCLDTVNVDLNNDGKCDLCGVPTATDGGTCVALISSAMLVDPSGYECPPDTSCDQM